MAILAFHIICIGSELSTQTCRVFHDFDRIFFWVLCYIRTTNEIINRLLQLKISLPTNLLHPLSMKNINIYNELVRFLSNTNKRFYWFRIDPLTLSSITFYPWSLTCVSLQMLWRTFGREEGVPCFFLVLVVCNFSIVLLRLAFNVYNWMP